jgi:hypothetical protein
MLFERFELFSYGCSIHTSSIEHSYVVDESEDHDYELDLDTYRPVQPLSNDHGVSFFPISAPQCGIDHHVLQVQKITCHILVDHVYMMRSNSFRADIFKN